jgi:WD40 repeat protein
MNFVDLWNPTRGEKSRIEPGCRSQEVFDLAFSPGGKELAIACGPGGEPPIGSLFVWDIAGRKAIFAREEIPQVRHLVYSPDGKKLATGGPDGVVGAFRNGRGNRLWGAGRAGHRPGFFSGRENFGIRLGKRACVFKFVLVIKSTNLYNQINQSFNNINIKRES